MRVLCLIPALLLAACVQTGPNRSEPNYAEAARLNTQLGLDYLRQGQVALAQSKLEKALNQDDSLAATHVGMALVHAHYGEDKEARSYFDRALRLAPNDPEILNNFGAHLCGRGQQEMAEEYFLRAVKEPRYPTPEVAYNNAGICYLQVGQAEKAEAFFRQALQVKPKYAPALLELADLYFQRQDYLRATAFLQRFEAARRDTISSLLLGLRLSLAQGKEIGVRHYAERLKQLDPTIDSRINLATGEPW